MAEKGFGAKEINLIGSSGTPTIESPGNLNLNANNVAISTNVSIGGTLTVSGNISVGGTLTYEDVTNIDSVGLITARSGIVVKDDATFETANSNNIVFDKSDNALEFGNGVKSVFNNNLQIYNDGTNRIKGSSGGIFIGLPGSFQIMDQNFANPKFEAGGTHAILYSAGVKVARSHEGRFEVGNPDAGIGIAATITTSGDARFVGVVTASSFIGSGANLTGIAITEAPVVDYTITGDGSNYYFHGGGVDGSAGDPDLYLIRGQKYRFNNTTGTGHPFRFTSTGNANAAYSKGVTGSESGVQFWTIPYDAPAKLFYVCTIHGGMVGNIYIRGANGQNDNVGVTTFTGTVHANETGNAKGIRIHSNGGISATDNVLRFNTGQTNGFSFCTNSDGGSSNERLRIISTGEMGLGTGTPPTGSFHIHLTETPELNLFSTQHSQGNHCKLNFGVGQSASVSGNTGARIEMNIPNSGGAMNGELKFHTNSGDNLVEKVRIPAQTWGLLVTNLASTGATGGYQTDGASLRYSGDSTFVYSGGAAVTFTRKTNAGKVIDFYNGTTYAGGIYVNGNNNTALQQGSDYRLKTDITSMTDGISKVKQLNPIYYKSKEGFDTTTVQNGFLAHEVQSVLPTLVDGEKDAPIDEKGKGYQTLNYAGFTPTAIAAIKELIAKVETLEAKVAALEGS